MAYHKHPEENRKVYVEYHPDWDWNPIQSEITATEIHLALLKKFGFEYSEVCIETKLKQVHIPSDTRPALVDRIREFLKDTEYIIKFY